MIRIVAITPYRKSQVPKAVAEATSRPGLPYNGVAW